MGGEPDLKPCDGDTTTTDAATVWLNVGSDDGSRGAVVPPFSDAAAVRNDVLGGAAELIEIDEDEEELSAYALPIHKKRPRGLISRAELQSLGLVVPVIEITGDSDEEEGNEPSTRRSLRRLPTLEANGNDGATRSSRRQTTEPMRFSTQQAEEQAMERMKNQLLRKGEKRSGEGDGNRDDRGSTKRSRAEERRNERMARRRGARSPEGRPSDRAGLLPTMLLDGGGPKPRRFVKNEDAVRQVVLHSTAWRHVRLREAECPPSNLLSTVNAPSARVLDKRLEDYDPSGTLATQCAIRLPSEIQPSLELLSTVSRPPIETTVTESLAALGPRLKGCRDRRVADVVATTRNQVRRYLKEIAVRRNQAAATSDHFTSLPISRLEQVATHKILRNLEFVEGEGIPTYTIGRGESALTEYRRRPEKVVYLSRVTPISRSTACIGVRSTLPVDDDPIIRFVPYFNQSNKADTAFAAQFPEFEWVNTPSLSACDDETKELMLRYVVNECNGDDRVFRVLRDLGIFMQPRMDYTALQERTLRERLSEKRTASELRRRPAISLAPSSIELMAFRTTFCRRCYLYNCQHHGIRQPTPWSRMDPAYPHIKAANRLAGVFAIEDDDGNESVENEVIDVDEDDQLAEVFDKQVGEQEGETEVEVEEIDEAVRRSKRARTAASTKASSMLVHQHKRASKRYSKTRVRHDSSGDASEYFGLSSFYRRMTDARRDVMLRTEGGCGVACHTAVAASMPSTQDWSPVELTLLKALQRSLGSHACLISQLLRTKECHAVQRQLQQLDEDRSRMQVSQSGLATGEHHVTSARGNSQEHLLRTRFQRMKDRGANHQYQPCHHPGRSCNAGDCACMRRDHFCERSCGCSLDCANRFPGCRCPRGACRSTACPCFFAGRECDPDVCISCGACDVPVLILDPSSSTKSNEQLRICANANLRRGRYRKIRITASTTHGWGAFAAEPMKEGDFIYEYTGELLSQDEAERRGGVYDRNTVSFLFDLNEDVVVDAARKGNKSKFANHTSADPNCVARIMLVNGDHRIGLYAKRDIAMDEELFFDYGYHGVVPDWSQSRIRSSGKSALVMSSDDAEVASVGSTGMPEVRSVDEAVEDKKSVKQETSATIVPAKK